MKTIITLRLDEESRSLLEAYAGGFEKFSTPIKKCDFHSTVYFSEEYHILPNEGITSSINSMLPLEIATETYCLDTFGKNHLVLRYDNRSVRDIEEMLRKMRPYCDEKGFSEEYVNFNPHITIAKNFDPKQLRFLPMFDGKIVFDSLRWRSQLK